LSALLPFAGIAHDFAPTCKAKVASAAPKQITRVDHPGAVIEEIAALLDRPHTADVRALTDTQFHVADATLIDKDPATSLHVARILARRIVEANKNFAELRSQILAGQSSSALSRALKKMEEIVSVGGVGYET
jgi:CRP/FNR family transcriptional regulator, cyclic AMP receptor protein